MAKLVNCKNCGGFIAKNADSCPSCGARVNRTSVLTWIAVVFIGFMVLSALMAGMSDNPSPGVADNRSAGEVSNNVAETDATQLNEVTEVQAVPNWMYGESVDKMRDTTTYTAITTSRNNVHLSSPYSGGTDLSIIIRHTDELNNEVLFVTNNGQLWCEYRNCTMTVKFDDNSIEQYYLSRAAGGSSEAMFLDGSEELFINKLKDSKIMMLEIGFYNNGNQQFTFDTADLDWQH